jgi:hypothetical protein
MKRQILRFFLRKSAGKFDKRFDCSEKFSNLGPPRCSPHQSIILVLGYASLRNFKNVESCETGNEAKSYPHFANFCEDKK